ncbi:MAG: Xaa-Pro peptidase family protein [Deinococcota bacterium]
MQPFSKPALQRPDYSARQAKLAQLEVDVVALVPSASLKYFTGLDFHLSERPIIVFLGDFGTGDFSSAAIVPELEMSRITARDDLNMRCFPWRDEDGYEAAFQAALDGLELTTSRLGVDGMTMRVTEYLELQKLAPRLTMTPVERGLIAIRARKDAAEITALKQSIAISERALHGLLAKLQVGMTERDIARVLADELTAEGSQQLSFAPLIQLGENSAFPHGNISDRALQDGDIVLIDFGGCYEDYPADITRTVCFGEPPEGFTAMFDAVLAANLAAIEATAPGVPMQDLDRAARSVIEAAGYGQYFIHRTGHGLGLDVHEPIPQLAEGVIELLEPGMVFTIEPGVYIPGIGGVRLEDDVCITETGVDVLTQFPKRWQISSISTVE